MLALLLLLAAGPEATVGSNLRRGDYAGSAACAGCHPKISAQWLASRMHRMTRDIAHTEVRAPFRGTSFAFKGDLLKFDTVGADRFMTLRSAASGNHVYRVTRVIGGRYREDFAGVEVARAAAGAPVLSKPGDEWVLPASFVFANNAFRHKGYSVMNTERPALRAGPVWNQTCIDCHNTVPRLSTLLGALLGPAAPGFQGEVVDRALPKPRRWEYAVTDPGGMAEAARAELATLGSASLSADAGTAQVLRDTLVATRDSFNASHLVEVGIGCEACHGGAREHVANAAVLPSYLPTSAFTRIGPKGPAASRAEQINRTCAQCHQVLFSRYPYTWEGGQRTRDPGGSHINSGEARDFLLSRCSAALACTACHDPHTQDSRATLDALALPAANGTCTGCHPQFKGAAALKAHAHHDPGGAGASCVGCHLPKKNVGLGYTLTRYHRIGSPNDPARVEHDRPLECALCHTEKTAEFLVSAMERFWGKTYDRAKLRVLYPVMGEPVLPQTLAQGKPHEQMVAMFLMGRAGNRAALPALISQLTHPYPLARYYAKQAAEEIAGQSLPVNLDQDADSIRAQAKAWLAGIPSP